MKIYYNIRMYKYTIKRNLHFTLVHNKKYMCSFSSIPKYNFIYTKYILNENYYRVG